MLLLRTQKRWRHQVSSGRVVVTLLYTEGLEGAVETVWGGGAAGPAGLRRASPHPSLEEEGGACSQTCCLAGSHDSLGPC